MNQDWLEKEIRQLFHNERQANESLTPDFASTLEAALSRRGRARPRRLILRVAFAAVALVTIGSVVLLVADRYSREQPPSLISDQEEPVTSRPPAPADLPVAVPREPPAKPVRRAHRRQTPVRRAAPLISQWRSPTEFLLKTPGDELLRTVPRLGASAVEIKLNLSSDKN